MNSRKKLSSDVILLKVPNIQPKKKKKNFLNFTNFFTVNSILLDLMVFKALLTSHLTS